MAFANWDEIRTAYQVARVGTVSGAADALGVHHATVIRHVDALETRLKTKLFQRHARGYTPTEAGQELLTVAKTTDDQFAQLAARLSGAGNAMTGELIVTSLTGLSPLITPTLVNLQENYPGLIIRYVAGARVLRLEYGEAHVAIRAGTRPEELDNVVQPLMKYRMALYASHDYVDRHGMPKDEADLANHRIIGGEAAETRAPFNRWMTETVPEEAIVFRTNDVEARSGAVMSGLGIGFIPVLIAQKLKNVVQVMAPLEEWAPQLWLVTHVDLHRTPKVQAFLSALKEDMRSWGGDS